MIGPRLRSWAPSLALCAVGALVIASARGPAAHQRSTVAETSETFVLPPPEELVRLSLGYRAALADLLWSHVMVTQGLRMQEKRRFETVTRYLDAIMTLDPDFREPYRLADTLTTMQVKAAPLDDIRAARKLLERGVERFPNDAELWLTLGQFVTFIAPSSYLQDEHPEEAERWRLEGARYLARAAELGSQDASIAWRAIGGVRHLHKAGETQATIRFIQRAIAVTEDEELRVHLGKQLSALLGADAARREQARRTRFEAIWRSAYPTWPVTAVLVAGPPFDPAACAGGSASPYAETSRCATSWEEWKERVDAELLAEDPPPSTSADPPAPSPPAPAP